MRTKVTQLSISGFRGATQPLEIDIDRSKPVLLVFGESGTGKSTIADAIDFVCNRRYGSLEDHSMASQPKSHVGSIGQDAKNLKVSLTTSQGKFDAILSKGGPQVTPATGCPEARILRRSHVLKLVDAQAKQRFEQIRGFVTVPGIERSEESLRRAADDARKSFDSAASSLRDAIDALDKLWTAEGRPAGSAMAWAQNEAAKELVDLETAVKDIGQIESAFTESDNALTSLDKNTADLAVAKSALEDAEKTRKELEARESEQSSSLLQLLNEAKSYLNARADLATCPVCEAPIDAKTLAVRLAQRIEEMAELSTAASAVTSAKRTLDSRQSVVNHARKDFCGRVNSLSALMKTSALEPVATLRIDWKAFPDLTVAIETSIELERQARGFLGIARACRASLVSISRADQKSIDQRNAVRSYLNIYQEKASSATSLECLSKKANRALEIVSSLRKSYVDGVLSDISREAERLYSALHPKEAIGGVRFYLKQSAIASLEFDGRFQNVVGLPPQAYYSESHLDTLGICVFLALTEHFMGENTLVVLDDVLTSVDEAHLDRFMTMLHDEAEKLGQVIVTTHFRSWRDRYRYARGPVAKTQVVELRTWCLESGVQCDEALGAIGELKDCLTAGKMDRQAIASKAGILLESILDALTLLYRCKMPRQSNPNFTLGDLGAGIDAKLGKVLRTVRTGASGGLQEETFLKPLVDGLLGAAWIRNRAGAHFSDLASEISDSDIRDFGAKVVQLADALVCSNCQVFPHRRPSGSYWECGCGQVQLHPLVQPGSPLTDVPEER